MTVIVNRCDLWDSAAHFQPDECFQAPNQQSLARVLPYSFAAGSKNNNNASATPPNLANGFAANANAPPPPGMEKQKQEESRPIASAMPVATARVPHRVESMEFPIQGQGEMTEASPRYDVIDTETPNPHDPDIVHGKYWAQRR